MAGLLAASLLAMVLVLGRVRDRLLVEDLRDQMYQAKDAELPAVFRRVESLGETGLPLATEALGSSKPVLAFAARDFLNRYLDKVESLAPAVRSSHLNALALALASRSDDLGPTASHWAADMATRILRLSPREDRADRNKLLAACERIVRSAAATEPSHVRLAARERPDDSRKPIVDETHVSKFDEDWITRQLAADDAKPGGGLPLPSVEVPALPVAPERPIGDRAAPSDDPSAPRIFNEPLDAEKLDGVPSRLPVQQKSAPVKSAPQPDGPVQINAESDHVVETKVRSPQGHDAAPDITTRDTRALIYDWHAALETDKAEFAKELRRRGFTDRDFLLAAKLADADPAVRARLARVLPRISSVAVSPWLWWLTEDANAQVRLTAISMLATSGNPEVRQRLRRLADGESDPRVAEQLRKILSR
ncbi:MAG: HEAT repeat domain-containing protein [Pirellulales bacterium]|nr:HEAT repeat domain-containing protein [Pirellulales bacterium]